GGPTGIVFNGDSTAFPVGDTNVAARFIFATESGTVAGWAGALGTTAQVKVDNSGAGASYKGLAIASTPSGSFLYAANFANARVDVFDHSWGSVTTTGGFSDPMLPADYAPFGIQTIGNRVFVAFAKQGEPEGGAVEEQKGQGRGMLRTADDLPVAIDGLWGLEFGHGAANNGPTNTLFFTAGPNGEEDGLFGMINAS